MGTYVYRVTAKQHRCSDGQLANIALYAYKPYWTLDGDAANRRMHVRSGAAAADNYARSGKLTDRFVLGHINEQGHLEIEPDAPVYGNPAHLGSFYDSSLGTTLTRLPDIAAHGTPNRRAQAGLTKAAAKQQLLANAEPALF